MAKQYRKRKKNYRAMSLKRLREEERRLMTENGMARAEHEKVLADLATYPERRKQWNEISDEVSEIRERIRNRGKSLFRRAVPTDDEQRRLNELEFSQNSGYFSGIWHNDGPREWARQSWSKKIEVTGSILVRVREIIRQKEVAAKRKARQRAIVAKANRKSREAANAVKNGLREQYEVDPRCPYCGGDIGTDPHCDHIYPIAHGGLSTPENMVWVCSTCNSRKSDKTLLHFIEEQGLTFEDVVARLRGLGKRV